MHAVNDAILGENGSPPLKDALYGTWLGHPFHPLMTDLPIGFWTSSAVLDLAGEERASDLMLGFGTVSALGAAATGFAQWHDVQEMEAPRRLGTLHAMLNVSATACYGFPGCYGRAGSERPALSSPPPGSPSPPPVGCSVATLPTVSGSA